MFLFMLQYDRYGTVPALLHTPHSSTQLRHGNVWCALHTYKGYIHIQPDPVVVPTLL